jgi:hypothetical protein
MGRVKGGPLSTTTCGGRNDSLTLPSIVPDDSEEPSAIRRGKLLKDVPCPRSCPPAKM